MSREQDDTTAVHLRYISAKVDEIADHLKALNGRTRKLEIRDAVYSWAIGLGGTAGAVVFVWWLNRTP